MAYKTVTYTFTNGSTIDASQHNQNYSDLTDALSAGVSDLNMAAGAFSSTLSVGSTLGVTGNFAVNTNMLTVDASNGNTVVAGTLGVTGILTTTVGASIGGGAFGAGASGVLTLGNGTLGASSANSVRLTSEDIAAGNTILSIGYEGSIGNGSYGLCGDNTTDCWVAIKLNGTVYYLLGKTTEPT